MIGMNAFKPVARLGYVDCTVVDDVFTLRRPSMHMRPLPTDQ